MVTGSEKVMILDIKTGLCEGTFEHERSVRSAVYNEGEARLLTVSQNREVRSWDVNKARVSTIIVPHRERTCDRKGGVRSAVFNKNKTRLLMVYARVIKIFDMRTGDCLCTFNPDCRPVSAVEFTEDETGIWVCHGDHSVLYTFQLPPLTLPQILFLNWLDFSNLTQSAEARFTPEIYGIFKSLPGEIQKKLEKTGLVPGALCSAGLQ